MTLTERIRAALARHPDRDDRHISKGIRGATLAAVRAVRAGEDVPEPAPMTPPPAAGTCEAGTITLDAVRARYDTAASIRAYVAELRKGVLKLEREVCQQTAGKDAGRFRRAVENNSDEFKAYRIRLKLDQDQPEGSWYWGNRETIAQAMRLRDSV